MRDAGMYACMCCILVGLCMHVLCSIVGPNPQCEEDVLTMRDAGMHVWMYVCMYVCVHVTV